MLRYVTPLTRSNPDWINSDSTKILYTAFKLNVTQLEAEVYTVSWLFADLDNCTGRTALCYVKSVTFSVVVCPSSLGLGLETCLACITNDSPSPVNIACRSPGLVCFARSLAGPSAIGLSESITRRTVPCVVPVPSASRCRQICMEYGNTKITRSQKLRLA